MSHHNTPKDFWSKVKLPDLIGTDECWEWHGRKVFSGDGYGSFDYAHKTINAHRLAYKFAVGPIPDGICVLHRCDNPPCCNPAHLFLGTRDINNKDRAAKGRSAPVHGEYNGHAKLTAEQVIDIRQRYIPYKVSYTDLGIEFGVSQDAIYRIVKRKNWRWL
jgi:hypothetical protein